ncbi:MAG: hypothetical protein LBS57_01945, partial [Treponema sp.]|nr:hypothetical protein [Treponema sp.]
MKKMIAILLILARLAPVFAGGGKETGGTSTTEPVKLVFWHHQLQAVNNFKAFAGIANEIFVKLGYPNVTMTSEQIEYQGYLAKYVSAFS